MSLVDVVRIVGVGVGVGIAGTMVVAPDAFGVHVRRVSHAARATASVARRITPFLPWPIRTTSVTAGRATAWDTLSVVGTATAYVRPGPTESIDRQIEALWKRIDELGGEINTARNDANQRAAAISTRLDNTTTRLDETADALRREMETERHRSTALNARGLPVIALGITLSGLPDRWVRLPGVAWPLVLLAITVTAFTIRTQVRERRGSRAAATA